MDPGRVLPLEQAALCPHSLSLRYPSIFHRTIRPVGTKTTATINKVIVKHLPTELMHFSNVKVSCTNVRID